MTPLLLCGFGIQGELEWPTRLQRAKSGELLVMHAGGELRRTLPATPKTAPDGFTESKACSQKHWRVGHSGVGFVDWPAATAVIHTPPGSQHAFELFAFDAKTQKDGPGGQIIWALQTRFPGAAAPSLDRLVAPGQTKVASGDGWIEVEYTTGGTTWRQLKSVTAQRKAGEFTEALFFTAQTPAANATAWFETARSTIASAAFPAE